MVELAAMDETLKVGIQQTTNIQMSANSWTQASLSVAHGSLGIRQSNVGVRNEQI